MSIETAILFSESAKRERLRILLTGVDQIPNALPLSVEDAVNVIANHSDCKSAWRLPTLAVMAAFEATKVPDAESGCEIHVVTPRFLPERGA